MRYALPYLLLAIAQASVTRAADAPVLLKEWTVDGVTRAALVYVPPMAAKMETPVIFAFHGHGGTAGNAATRFNFQKHWLEAIVVYPQGLRTPTARDPDGQETGWQKAPGEQKDRDLRFFDAILTSLKQEYLVDAKRVYATGHSDGGGFTYLLWAERGDVFAAIASCAAGARKSSNYKPLPALHIAGENDEIVPFENQERTMEAIRKLNGCRAAGKPWHKSGSLVGTIYASPTGTPFISLIHPGSHIFPAKAPEMIVLFFKEHAKK